MKTLTKGTSNFNRRDMINSKNGTSLQDLPDGTLIKAKKIGILEDVDEDGQAKIVAVIVAEDGEVYTSISPSIAESANETVDLIEDGEEATLELKKRTSKGGREFLSFIIK